MKWLKAVSIAGGSIVVYLCTLAGIFIAQFGPQLVSTDHAISLKTYGIVRLILSAIMAGYIMVGQESGGDDAGKAKNLKRRVINAFNHGLGWNTLIGMAGAAAQAGT